MVTKVAVIGVSHWHALFDAAYLVHLGSMPDVTVVGVHDGDVDLAAERAKVVAGARIFADYRKMLDETKPDFVVALGRHDEMATIAHHLLDCGIPFLMEKPLGVNASEVATIAERIRKTKAYVAVPLAQRYLPEVTRIRQMLAEGSFGQAISMFRYRFLKPSPQRYTEWGSKWMLDSKAAGGGCLRNFGIHALDLFCDLFGPAEVVAAQISNEAYRLSIEDYAVLLVRSASGVIGSVEVGYTLPQGRDIAIEVAGSDRWIQANGGRVVVRDARGDHAEDVAAPHESPHAQILRDSLDRWRRGNPPPVGIEECLRAVRLVDDAYALAGRLATAGRDGEASVGVV